MVRLPVHDPICDCADDVREQARHILALRTIGIKVERKPKMVANQVETKAPNMRATVKAIIRVINKHVSAYFNCGDEDIFNSDKDGNVAKARWVAIYFVKKATGLKGDELAYNVGLKRRQTVNQSITRVNNRLLRRDDEISKAVRIIGTCLREQGLLQEESPKRKRGDADRRETATAGRMPISTADANVALRPQIPEGTL